jgi:hypothetical protein
MSKKTENVVEGNFMDKLAKYGMALKFYGQSYTNQGGSATVIPNDVLWRVGYRCLVTALE